MFNVVLGIATCVIGIFCLSLGACAIAACINTKDWKDIVEREKEEK